MNEALLFSLSNEWACEPETAEIYDSEGTWIGAMADIALAEAVVTAHNERIKSE